MDALIPQLKSLRGPRPRGYECQAKTTFRQLCSNDEFPFVNPRGMFIIGLP